MTKTNYDLDKFALFSEKRLRGKEEIHNYPEYTHE